MKQLILLSLFSILSTSSAFACEDNYDCDYGSVCLKSGFEQYGVCAGGQNAGNKHDKKPVYDPYNRHSTVGNSCSYDTDCDYPTHCFKGNFALSGVCH